MNLTIAICDDEEKSRKDIYSKLLSINNEFKIDVFSSGESFLAAEKTYDIVFMDINMNGIDGMKTAEHIKNRKITEHLIFLTWHTDFMQNAFKVRAFRYLSKPASISEIKEALLYIEEEFKENLTITIKESGNIFSFNINSIICFEAFGDGTYVYTNDKVYTTTVSRRYINRILHDLVADVCFLRHVEKTYKNCSGCCKCMQHNTYHDFHQADTINLNEGKTQNRKRRN